MKITNVYLNGEINYTRLLFEKVACSEISIINLHLDTCLSASYYFVSYFRHNLTNQFTLRM